MSTAFAVVGYHVGYQPGVIRQKEPTGCTPRAALRKAS
jgi:hypothetical protein